MREVHGFVLIILLSIYFFGCVSLAESQEKIESNLAESQEKINGELEATENQSGLNPSIQTPDTLIPDSVDDCVNLSDYDKAFCFSDVAVLKNDIEVCKSIRLENNSQQQQLNIDYCMAVFAFHKEDVGLCSQLQTTPLREACFIDFAISSKNTRICDEVTDEQNKYTNCYTKIAELQSDTEICGRIENSDYMNLCKAKVSKEVKYCTPINDVGISDACYLQSAWDDMDWKSCSGIRDEMHHDFCLAAIAAQLKDETICVNVIIEQNFQNCLYEVEKA